MTQRDDEKSKLQDASLGQLTGELSQHVSRLVRDEIRLAQTEMTQKGKRLGAGAGLMSAGAGLAMFGLGCLVATAVLALDLMWAAWTAALVVGLALFVIAGTAALMGRSQMRQSTPPVPREAIDSTKQDIEALKGNRL